MADQKTSQLTETTTLADADMFYLSQGGSSDKKISGVTIKNLSPNTPTAVFGDGNDVASLEAGLTCFVRVPYGGTIREWTLVADATTTCVLDVWKAAGSLPTNSDSITAAAKPGLTAATVGGSTSLGTWTTTVTSGDVFGFELESFTGSPTQITLTLRVA